MKLTIHQKISVTFNRDILLHQTNSLNQPVGEVILTFTKGESLEGCYIDIQEGWYALELTIKEKYERVRLLKESVTIILNSEKIDSH